MPEIVSITNDRLTVEVSSSGAEMQSLVSSDGRSWLWNGDAAWWSGRSPILFPIVGKAPGNKLTIDGRQVDMAQHGFARRNEFALVNQTQTSCAHRLTATDATRSVYPFEFALTLTHSLDGSALTVAAEVENLDEKPMPFGIGFHSAFSWPLPGAEGKAHMVQLENRAEPPLARLEDGLLRADRLPSPFAGGKLEVSPEMFVEDAMIFTEGTGTALTYGVDGGEALHFSFENLPNLALWTKPGAPFLCVEPWHGTAAAVGASDDITERPFTKILPPGENARFAFTVEIPA